MSYTTGKAKPLENIRLDDILQYPIWVWDWDDEGKGAEERETGQDETWQKPVTDTKNLTKEIFDPTITLQVKDSAYYASGQYDQDTGELQALSIWQDNGWVGVEAVKDLQAPLVFVAVPSIDGQERVEFVCEDLHHDLATRRG